MNKYVIIYSLNDMPFFYCDGNGVPIVFTTYRAASDFAETLQREFSIASYL